MGQFCVIGLGNFGIAVAQELGNRKEETLVIEKNDELVDDIKDYVTRAVTADSTDIDILRKLHVEDFDVVIVGIGDVKDSILTCRVLKELNVANIIAKAVDFRHQKVLQKIGVEKVIIPERETAVDVVNKLVERKFFDQIQMSEEHSLVEMAPPRKWIGHTLSESDIRKKFEVSVIGIRKKFSHIDETGETNIVERLVVSPGPEEMVDKDDIVIILGENKFIEKLRHA